MPKGKTEIAIAGAGIAGLTAALALSKAGFNISVFERNPALQTAGTGIQVSCNAIKILDSLGLGDPLRAGGFAPDAVHIGSGISNRKLSRFALGETIEARHGAPYLVIHRAVLAQILKQACDADANISVRFNSRLNNVCLIEGGVALEIETPEGTDKRTAAALIGADGVGSVARNAVSKAARPVSTGYIAWRAVVPASEVPATLQRSGTGLWLGPNAHLVHYPLPPDGDMNVVAIAPWRGAGKNQHGWVDTSGKEQRLAGFCGWSDELRDVVALDADWGGWPLNAVSQTGAWAKGAVGLIGDAAHPMVPFAAQGGSMAIEDAAVVAKLCLESATNLPKALERLGKERARRVNRVIRLSERNRRVYHTDGPKTAIRNLVLKTAPSALLQTSMDWLYGWEV